MKLWRYYTKGIILVIYDSSTLGLSENTMLGFLDSSKLGEGLGCTEGASLVVYGWGVECISWGDMLGTNVWNDEYTTISIS